MFGTPQDQNQTQNQPQGDPAGNLPPAISKAMPSNDSMPPTAPPLATAPPLSDAMSSQPGAPAVPPPLPVDTGAAHKADDEMEGVSLENAYIDPAAPIKDSPADDKPTAASLISDAPAPAGDLLDIKQKALQNLGPLVGHLDQPTEERFKTLMMLIQGSDNPQYLQEAYDAANKITDEKVRAQALLDVVNEINYFTQKAK